MKITIWNVLGFGIWKVQGENEVRITTETGGGHKGETGEMLPDKYFPLISQIEIRCIRGTVYPKLEVQHSRLQRQDF